MTSSGAVSVDFEIAEFVDEAFERIGISPESLNGRHARSARRSLDFILKIWSARFPHQWKITEQTFTPAAGESSLILDSGSFAVVDAVVRDSESLDTPIFPISRSEWLAMPDKDIRGRPDRYWVEQQQDARIVHFWQTQGDQGYSLIFHVASYIFDVGVPTNTFDIPPEWWEATASALAHALAVKYAPDREPQMNRLAEKAYRDATQTNHQRADFRFVLGGA